jgi:hypothetical protein
MHLNAKAKSIRACLLDSKFNHEETDIAFQVRISCMQAKKKCIHSAVESIILKGLVSSLICFVLFLFEWIENRVTKMINENKIDGSVPLLFFFSFNSAY